MKSKIVLLLFSLFFLLFCLSGIARGQANVSRSPFTQSISPRIAVDSVGNVHVVWAEYYTAVQDKPSPGSGDAFYAKYDITAQQWSVPLNLSRSSQVYTAECRPVGIDIDGGDNIYVVYVNDKSLMMRVCSGGNWEAPFEVNNNNEDTDSARIAVDPNGNIFTCWWTINTGVVYSKARVGGVWESVKTLSPSGRRSKFPTIAVGNSIVACCWQEGGTDLGYAVGYVQRGKSLDAAWSSSQPVAAAGSVITPDVAINASDVSHVVWATKMNPDWETAINYSYRIGTGWSPIEQLSGIILQVYPAIYQRGGNLYVCWSYGPWGHGKSVHFNNKINGTWSGDAKIPNATGNTFTDVATSPDQSQVYYVWDDMGMNPTGTWEVYCNLGETGSPPENEPPVAEFSYSPTAGKAPLQVNFDASGSSDPDGSIIQYSWNFGDGGIGSGKVVSHVYTKGGTFTIGLTVRDNGGALSTKTTTITVSGVLPPLNISWTKHLDESLLLSRYVTEVTWQKNPENDALGNQVTLYRIYRKRSTEGNNAYTLVGEVTASTYLFIDTDPYASGKDTFSYTVTAVDNQGHESPISAAARSLNNLTLKKQLKNTAGKGKIARS
jgi:PKD repeat protein